MPNYHIHDWSIHLTTPILTYAIYTISDPYTAFAFACGYMFGGYLMTPDLDIPSRIYKRWKAFRWIWKPYQLVIPHRSILSHSGPISATIRGIYIGIPLLIAYFLLTFYQIIPLLNESVTFYLVWVWLGLCLSDVLHTLMDISGFWKGN